MPTLTDTTLTAARIADHATYFSACSRTKKGTRRSDEDTWGRRILLAKTIRACGIEPEAERSNRRSRTARASTSKRELIHDMLRGMYFIVSIGLAFFCPLIQ